MHFSEGIWTYLGRTQYATGRLREVRQSLERALAVEKEDRLAKRYLGLALLGSGDKLRGLSELRTGLRSLHDRLEHIVSSRMLVPYWDPDRRIRSEIQKPWKWLEIAMSTRTALRCYGLGRSRV